MSVRSIKFLLFLLFLESPAIYGQEHGFIDVSRITLYKEVADYSDVSFFEKKEIPGNIYPSREFRPLGAFRNNVPGKLISKKALLKVSLVNPGDSAVSMVFFPGFYYPSVKLYKDIGKSLVPLALRPTLHGHFSFQEFEIGPKDTMVLVAELTFLKTYNNKIRPRLVHPSYLQPFMYSVRLINRESDITSFVFSGLLLMMILYSLAVFFQVGSIEFLYYSAYALMTAVMLVSKAVTNFRDSKLGFFVESYLDFILQCLGIIFYMLFMQLFLDTRNKFPFLRKLYQAGIVFLCFVIFTFSAFHYGANNYPVENIIENITKVVLMGMVIIFLVYSIRHRNEKLLRYLFWGNLFFLLFSILSFLLIIVPGRLGLQGFFSNSLLYYEAGLFFELGFFLSALNFKNRTQIIEETREREILRAQNILKEYEKEMAVYKAQQEERERISADMHDELGSGLTAIRLMSEIARNKMKDQTPVEIEKISHSADDVLNKMNAIIWSMNSSNDTLESLIAYIRSYAIEYFDNTPVYCRVNAPEQFRDSVVISGVKRRNIFLCVKESLNNIMKHSGANKVQIDIGIRDGIEIKITDNGVGIDPDKLSSFGNGLKNMRKRMENIGGSFRIRSEEGTITTIRLPI